MLRGLPFRVSALFRRRSMEAEMDAELRAHIEHQAEKYVRSGMSHEEAARRARLEFGGIEQVKEECRDSWGMRIISELAQDLRYGLRQLRRNPGFTAVAVLTLALGIGATTAIFSVVYGVLLRPLPYPRPNRLVSISEAADDGHLMGFTGPNFRDLRAMNHTLGGMALCQALPATVVGPSGPSRVSIALVTADFSRVMEVAPMIGRGFSPDGLDKGAAPAALVSYGYWRQQLGGAPDLLPFKITAEGHVFSVAGVMPPGFNYPAHADLWIPAELFGVESTSRTAHNWSTAVGRLRDGVTLAQARSDLSVLAGRLYQQYKPRIDMRSISITPLRSALTANVRPALLILLAAVGFLLLVGCANVANLMLARATARKRELAVRSALGAERGRLVRQFLTETLLLSLTAGALGVLLALLGVDALLGVAPPGLPRIQSVSVSVPVLAFALAISLLVATGLGVATALKATTADPQVALAEGNARTAGSPTSPRLAQVLIAGQVAATLVLLAGAGLLGRSLLRVLSINPGFRTANIVSIELEVPHPAGSSSLSPSTSQTNTQPARFMDTLLGRLRALPGVEEVGGISDLPLAEGGPCRNGRFLLLDQEPHFNPANPEDGARLGRLWATAPGGEAGYCVASPGYFKVLGIPLLRGRLFNQADTDMSPQVAIVSQSLARATWPGKDPLGRTIEFGNMDGDLRLLTIVGVVGDVRSRSLESPPDPTVYVNFSQRLRGGRDFTVVMRSSGPPGALSADARHIFRKLAPGIAPQFQTFRNVFSASLHTRRFNLTLLGVFAVTALLLAAVGVLGVMAYWVSQRTNEIGIRMALGASSRQVLGMVLREGLSISIFGVAIGIAGALALTRFLSSLLYGVTPTDPLTFIAVSLILIAVALLACYIPARRAAKVDPMVALRYE